MPPNPLSADLDHVLSHTAGLWEDLRGKRLFLTGGTGFLGCWLLESLLWADAALGLGVEAVVLSRNPAAFRAKQPHLAGHPAVRLHEGDTRTFSFPAGEFTHVIHAATDASAALNADNPLLMIETITQGTKQALEFARQCGCRRFLLVSSGGVYGRQPPETARLPEEYSGAPDTSRPQAAYGEGKRLAELYSAIYGEKYGLQAVTARGFAFVGPYLPLDRHFAVGNFIRDGLRGGPIEVGGDGTPIRSYLYGADLAIWLWTILLRGTPGRAYNVGSEEAITIEELARTVSRQFSPLLPVRVAGQSAPNQRAERYVPSTQRARQELGLEAWISLEEALRRTIRAAVGEN